jgi:uncharacterized membrane protein YfcA
LFDYSLLCLAAFAAGVVNTIAGGGTLLTFPTLLRVLGMRPAFEVLANATSTVALVPGSIAGAWGYRREMKGTGPWLLLLGGPSLLGGLLGSLLLTRLPGKYFAILVPWLLLTASLLFLLQPYLTPRRTAAGERGLPSGGRCVAVAVFQFFVAVYGGYFGAGIGILMLSALALMDLGDIHRMNGIKTLLNALINGVSVVVFVSDHKVVWNYALAMAVAAILGGLSGARLGRLLPRRVVRWFVILVGLSLAGYYFARR